MVSLVGVIASCEPLGVSTGLRYPPKPKATGLRGGRDVWCFHPRPSSKRSRWSGLDSVGGQVGNPKLSNLVKAPKQGSVKASKISCVCCDKNPNFDLLSFISTEQVKTLDCHWHVTKGSRESCVAIRHTFFGSELSCPGSSFPPTLRATVQCSCGRSQDITRPYCKIRIVPCNDLMIWFSYIIYILILMCMWMRQIDHIEKTVREVGRNDLNHRFEPMRPAQAG